MGREWFLFNCWCFLVEQDATEPFFHLKSMVREGWIISQVTNVLNFLVLFLHQCFFLLAHFKISSEPVIFRLGRVGPFWDSRPPVLPFLLIHNSVSLFLHRASAGVQQVLTRCLPVLCHLVLYSGYAEFDLTQSPFARELLVSWKSQKLRQISTAI